MKKGYIQLFSTINIMIMVFCLLTIPGEVEKTWDTTAKYVAWAVIIAVGMTVAAILAHCLRKEGTVAE